MSTITGKSAAVLGPPFRAPVRHLCDRKLPTVCVPSRWIGGHRPLEPSQGGRGLQRARADGRAELAKLHAMEA